MSQRVTIGGDRLGSGKKMKAELHGFNRSTHDLSYVWRSSMAPGTLVPFLCKVALPGDTFDIDLECDIKTHPTLGPLFGSFKVQLDVFQAPIRLYEGKLHNNALKIGLKMSDIKLPQIEIGSVAPDFSKGNIDNQQINPSCIFSYLGIRGVGIPDTGESVIRYFNGIPYLAYWDIYKNYYANKQEEIGAVISSINNTTVKTIDDINAINPLGSDVLIPEEPTTGIFTLQAGGIFKISFTGAEPKANEIIINTNQGAIGLPDLFNIIQMTSAGQLTASSPKMQPVIYNWRYVNATDTISETPNVVTFPLDNIDDMRNNIMAWTNNNSAFIINLSSADPYGLPLKYGTDTWSKQKSLEGLALKTYQSDLFNNWMQTEWLDGAGGINEITAIDTSSGEFTIDTLQLSKKVYDLLNRIAISGGTYQDWVTTVWDHESKWLCESPMYMGGLIKELVFEEVISNAQTTGEETTQPLGTLGGRGRLSGKHKGGNATIKVDEPSYIIGIVSLTPRIDYSQGNTWDVNLKTMDDLHKPGLDQIGFQDLITDQMAWWDTEVDVATATPIFKSAGKQPAWINYMTSVNETRGNFAIENNEMFMTLNRRYEIDETPKTIKDLTTYIDPAKFNNIFAETKRDAQNFWAQIGVKIEARRKMSARVIPNL